MVAISYKKLSCGGVEDKVEWRRIDVLFWGKKSFCWSENLRNLLKIFRRLLASSNRMLRSLLNVTNFIVLIITKNQSCCKKVRDCDFCCDVLFLIIFLGGAFSNPFHLVDIQKISHSNSISINLSFSTRISTALVFQL